MKKTTLSILVSMLVLAMASLTALGDGEGLQPPSIADANGELDDYEVFVRCAALYQGSASAAVDSLDKLRVDANTPKGLRMIARTYSIVAQVAADIPFEGNGTIDPSVIDDVNNASERYRLFLEPHYQRGNTKIENVFERDVDFCGEYSKTRSQ